MDHRAPACPMSNTPCAPVGGSVDPVDRLFHVGKMDYADLSKATTAPHRTLDEGKQLNTIIVFLPTRETQTIKSEARLSVRCILQDHES